MGGAILFGVLTALVLWMGWWMVTRPERPLPGRLSGGYPPPERARVWGWVLVCAGFACLAATVWAFIAATA